MCTQLQFRYRTSIPEGRSDQVMDMVGIPYEIRETLSGELSAEMKIRGAIDRSLVNEPWILLCDEPTRNPDPGASRRILTLLESQNKQGILVIIATEDIEYARRAPRTLHLLMDT